MRIRDYVAVVITVAVSNLFFLYLHVSFFYLHHQNPGAQSSVVDPALHAAMLRRLTEEGCHCHCHSSDSSSSSTSVVPVAYNKAAPLFRPIVPPPLSPALPQVAQQPPSRTAPNPESTKEEEEDDGTWPPRQPRSDPQLSLRDVRQAILNHHELMKVMMKRMNPHGMMLIVMFIPSFSLSLAGATSHEGDLRRDGDDGAPCPAGREDDEHLRRSPGDLVDGYLMLPPGEEDEEEEDKGD